MLIGPSASGKSTYSRYNVTFTGATHISRDDIRFSLLRPGEDYFSHEDEVFSAFINMIQDAIDHTNKDVWIDATHLNEKSRNKTLNRLRGLEYETLIAVFFNMPIDLAIGRNASRKGREFVPPEVIQDMYNTLTMPTFHEKHRYDEIWIVDSDGKLTSRIRSFGKEGD